MKRDAILYSFRRCPYAIRSRLALAASEMNYELREVSLKNKPSSMLLLSDKGTVPVLTLNNGVVIDESLDIMLWALQQNDPQNLLPQANSPAMECSLRLIQRNDTGFKKYVDRYKYADRFPEKSKLYYREKAEVFIQSIEEVLQKHEFLLSGSLSLLDLAVVPFVRQFAYVDQNWFFHSDYLRTIHWLNSILQGELFLSVMHKNSLWEE